MSERFFHLIRTAVSSGGDLNLHAPIISETAQEIHEKYGFVSCQPYLTIISPTVRKTPSTPVCTSWGTRDEDIAVATVRGEAKRVAALDTELKEITKRITDLVRRSLAGTLLDQLGIGPVTAAVALTSWSHLGRIRFEAAFASLAGTSPIPASSGNTVRYRINRGGDRRLNRALHMAIVTRMRTDPRASNAAPPKDTPSARSVAASSDTSPGTSTADSTPPPAPSPRRLDKHRRFNDRLEHPHGSALGFRNLINYRLRSLLEAGGFRPVIHSLS